MKGDAHMEAVQSRPQNHLMHFAAGNYMLRSERRRSTVPPTPPAPEEPRKPKEKKPRVKRTSAGFIYKLITVLLSVILWPVGLILLVRKYLRWKPFTKFLAACITFACFVFLYGFLLTVNTGNEQYTQIQDTINSHIEAIAEDVSHGFDVLADRYTEISDGADNLFRAALDAGSFYLADIIDAGVDISMDVRTKIEDLTGYKINTVPEATPEPTSTPEPEPTPRTTTDPNSVILTNDYRLVPLYIPSSAADPATGIKLGGGTLTQYGIIADGPTATPDISVYTPVKRSYLVKPASAVKVYFNIGSGTYYHTSSSCGSMKTAKEYTLAEAAENGMLACSRCNPLPLDFLEEHAIVWVDEKDTAHTTDKCAEFSGKWTIITASDALERNLTACAECNCNEYLDAIANGDEMEIVSSEQFAQ